MLLQHGDVNQLKAHHWYLMEFSSDHTIQPTMHRAGQKIPSLFGTDPIEIFMPIARRDLNVFELRTGQYAFVRSTNFNKLLKLRTVTGIVGLVTEGGTNNPTKALRVEDAYVQGLIAEAAIAFEKRSVGIVRDSFVRVIDGPSRDYCGVVAAIRDGWAAVVVKLRTKQFVVRTPTRNLLNLSHVPANRRVYYYGAHLDELFESNPKEAAELVAVDLVAPLKKELVSNTDKNSLKTPPIVVKSPERSRQNTPTALIRSLIYEGVVEPMQIAKRVMDAIANKDVRKPRNAFIIHGLIKQLLVELKFKGEGLTDWRKVVWSKGAKYRFTPAKIAALKPSLGLPIASTATIGIGNKRAKAAKARAKRSRRRGKQ